MKAAIYHEPMHVTGGEVDRPEVAPNGIIIRSYACGICGSDLHMYRLGVYSDVLCRASPQGLIPGHEFSGEIVEVGAEVKDLSVGDRVVAFTFGGMAEYVPVSPAMKGLNVVPIPDSISYTVAATLEPLANSVHATLKGHPEEGETAVVFGAGIIGLGVIQCLRVLAPGIKQVIAVDVSDYRLEMARHLGADATINASTEDVFARVLELAGEAESWIGNPTGMPAVEIVYDCVGLIQEREETPVLQHAINIARPGTGRIVEHGIFEVPITLEMTTLVGKQISILGSYGFVPEDTVKAIELIESGKVDREILITGEYPTEEAGEAFRKQATADASIKVMICP